jgi:hypothetical protein
MTNLGERVKLQLEEESEAGRQRLDFFFLSSSTAIPDRNSFFISSHPLSLGMTRR